MGSPIPLFIIGFALNSLTGLPNKYIEKLCRGNRICVSIFNSFTISAGLLLTMGDLPGFLKENNFPIYWFFLPYAIAVTVWVIKSWEDRIKGVYGFYYWILVGITGFIITLVGVLVGEYSWIIIHIP